MSEIDQDALKKAVAEEIARLTADGTLTIPTVPAGEVASILPAREKAGNYEFDPQTKRILNPHARRQLWREDNIKQCACGQQKWAHVQEFVGERAITDALRPVVDTKTGQLVQMPHTDAFSQYTQDGTPMLDSCVIPEELRMTPEKAAHARECKGAMLEGLEAAGELEQINEEQARAVIRGARHGA